MRWVAAASPSISATDLSVRWPAWHARLANFLMEDPLHGLRGQLAARLAELDAGSPQQDLFAGAR